MGNEKRHYLLYDARAWYDIDRAIVCTVSDSLAEAKEDKADICSDGVIYSYLRDAEGDLCDERFEE